MPRNYKRPIGARKYKDYTEDNLQAAVCAVKNGLSLRQAAEKYGISRCAVTAAVKGRNKKVGRPCVLSDDEQNVLVECITLAGDWGFPLTIFDIRLIVKGFLDRSGRTELRFTNNMPGNDFAIAFIKRHALSNRLCQNIKRSRAAVNKETINSYFDELAITCNGVEPCMILNYDETNITDDPGRQKVIVRRGCRHPERIIDFSKASTSVMFSGSGDGTLLPPYICYKAAHLYDSWTENGPKGAVYNRSKSGWFTLEIFKDWFRKIAVPYFKKFDNDAVKVLIGDNLASHISPNIISECKAYNIKFVLLPPNSTHYTQPLDVSFFRPLKIKWRETLYEWKLQNRGSLPKDKFPRLLKKCIEQLGENNGKQNLISGFKASGIVPLDRDQVLKRIPDGHKKKEGENLDTSKKLVESFESYLQQSREKETQPIRRRKKIKLNVPAGRGIEGLDVCNVDLQENESAEPQPCSSTQAQKRGTKRSKAELSESSDNDKEEYSVRDSDSELFLEESTDDNFDEEPKTEDISKKLKKKSVNMGELKPDVYVVVELLFNENTKKPVMKQFYAAVLETKPKDRLVTVKFLRKSTKSIGNDYIFPVVDDVMEINICKVVAIVVPVKVHRGRYTFPYVLE